MESLDFEGRVAFDPAGVVEEFLRAVPARWGVYLLEDDGGRPVQLLVAKNLRAALKRRLILGEQDEGPSKRVDYRQLVRSVRWRRVDSRFEADATYLAMARWLFPEAWAEMVRLEPPQFVHVDPDAPFPRFVRTSDLSLKGGVYLGPLEDRRSAQKLVEQVEAAFDLCRYHNVLVEAPRGRACAYKEMGRCPAPCDGTVSMGAYRQILRLALATLSDPADAARQQEARMRQAAAEMKFELAGRIKQYADELAALTRGANRHVRPLGDFRFVAIMPGPRKGTGKVFLATPGAHVHVASLIGEPDAESRLLRVVLERGEVAGAATGLGAAEHISLVSAHLFAPAKQAVGAMLPLAELDQRALSHAWRELSKRPDEGSAEGSEEGT